MKKKKKLTLDLEIKRLSKSILKGQYGGPWCPWGIITGRV
jgi:hypothetical protein